MSHTKPDPKISHLKPKSPEAETNNPQPESSEAKVSDAKPEPSETQAAPVTFCEHIMASGKRCGSPAISGQKSCYYHINLHYRLPYARLMFLDTKKNPAPGEWPFYEFPIPDLEDAAAIQIAFQQVLHGICNGIILPGRARLVLSALHGASANLNRFQQCVAAGRNSLEKLDQNKRALAIKQARSRSRNQRKASA